MIRITNSMMNNNTKNNINLNKTSADTLNTMIATGQKITKPSDDPVIAIRALRLNTNIAQLNQYYDKNIPDATAWLTITESALSQTDQIFTSIKENLTTGASDDNTESDRMKILESLKALRDQIYSSGNADYADRTVFTGYRTSESLTVLNTDDKSTIGYTDIKEPLSSDDIDTFTYIKGVTDDYSSSVEQDVDDVEVSRIRLAYDTIDATNSDGSAKSYTLTYTAKGSTTPTTVTLTAESLTGTSADDDLYTDGKTHLIADTGEIILSDELKTALSTASDISISYDKSSWETGDLRPEHYFSCVDMYATDINGNPVKYNYNDNGEPDFQEQDIRYEVSFNQTITINTHASEVYSHDIGRDVDELVELTQKVIDAGKVLTKLDEAGTDKDSDEYKAAQKAYDLLSDQCQKSFSNALTKFDNYADTTNLAIANIGSMSARLTITKERVADQLESFTELADDNINAELTDTAIDLSNAELALEAAQMAASKIAQQTLLNYL